MSTASEILQAQLWDVSDIEAPAWNPNVMNATEYARLKKDMEEHGPASIDPVRCYHKTIVVDAPAKELVTYDGAHRLRAAKELGWKQMYVIVDTSIRTEADARIVNHRKNTERGRPDEFKEAENFRWFQDEQHLTHEQIAQIFGIDRTTVTKRLSLFNIEPEVKATLAKNTRFTVSHIEPLATLPPDVQKEVAKEIVADSRRDEVTVRDVEDTVRRTKQQLEAAEKFRKAVEASEYKACPTCGKPPEEFEYGSSVRVRCSGPRGYSSEHIWSLKTGKTQAQENEIARKTERKKGAQKRSKEPDQFVRTTHTVEEFQAAFAEFVKQVIPRFKSITDIRVSGEADSDNDINLSINTWSGGGDVSLSFENAPKYDDQDIHLHITPKEYNVKALKDYKAVIWGGRIKSEKDAKEIEKRAIGFLEKYGSPPAKPKKEKKELSPKLKRLRGEIEDAIVKLEELDVPSAGRKQSGSSRRTTSTPASGASTRQAAAAGTGSTSAGTA